jgi:hypothetical protein
MQKDGAASLAAGLIHVPSLKNLVLRSVCTLFSIALQTINTFATLSYGQKLPEI